MKICNLVKALALGVLPLTLASPAATTPQCGVPGDGDDFYTSSTVSNILECQYKCKSDAKCLSSEFKPSTGTCWLYAKPVAQAKTRNDTTGKWFFNDRDCLAAPAAPQCNISGDGSDFYKKSTASTVSGCQSACSSDPKCLSSEYKPSDGSCWLYAGPVSQAKTRNDTSGTYYFYDRNCPIPATTPQCNIFGDGSSYYTSSTVNTLYDCQSTCIKDPKCSSSEYKPSSGSCWLYATPVSVAKTKNDTGTYIFNDRNCPVKPGPLQCRVAGDGSSYYKSSTVKSVTDCQNNCKNDTKCLSSEYKPSSGGCWLYSAPVSVAKTKNDTSGTYYFYDRDCPLPKCGLNQMELDFYTTSNVSSLQACQSTCNSDPKCLSFNYRADTGVCGLSVKPVADSSPVIWVGYDRDCAVSS
ncbi:uncharacterized protein TRIVIDRAFT_65028 [Trichoderma virens Gv29-8]|uniref:Apple domain-containing protein n=1 Tax=Hypocrea virens (strain Gv29-8 / FGSC 10586) TaxID=413071 RepID=G9NBF0_HYPVG|nr:uncharacterized protein TRIVIDRAFT_65028 [Trichoderma virens Gv29-8]EHK16155.1 hypothetical protein TRIVIDRAFT_65028 [Trichoderma virens Gv29-8]